MLGDGCFESEFAEESVGGTGDGCVGGPDFGALEVSVVVCCVGAVWPGVVCAGVLEAEGVEEVWLGVVCPRLKVGSDRARVASTSGAGRR